MKAIKFVYFDIGGVLIKDFSKTNKWQEMKKFMGVAPAIEKEFDDLYDYYEHLDVCLTRPVDSLVPIFEEKFSMKFPDNFSMQQYFIDHFEKNLSIWPIVKTVVEKYKIGILSNQYVGMLDEIVKRKLLPETSWDIVVDSTKVGLQKPDSKIFEYSQNQAGVASSEILFVDNSTKNIEAAKNLNWQTFYYDSADHIKSCKELSAFLAKLNLI